MGTPEGGLGGSPPVRFRFRRYLFLREVFWKQILILKSCELSHPRCFFGGFKSHGIGSPAHGIKKSHECHFSVVGLKIPWLDFYSRGIKIPRYNIQPNPRGVINRPNGERLLLTNETCVSSISMNEEEWYLLPEAYSITLTPKIWFCLQFYSNKLFS